MSGTGEGEGERTKGQQRGGWSWSAFCRVKGFLLGICVVEW